MFHELTYFMMLVILYKFPDYVERHHKFKFSVSARLPLRKEVFHIAVSKHRELLIFNDKLKNKFHQIIWVVNREVANLTLGFIAWLRVSILS